MWSSCSSRRAIGGDQLPRWYSALAANIPTRVAGVDRGAEGGEPGRRGRDQHHRGDHRHEQRVEVRQAAVARLRAAARARARSPASASGASRRSRAVRLLVPRGQGAHLAPDACTRAAIAPITSATTAVMPHGDAEEQPEHEEGEERDRAVDPEVHEQRTGRAVGERRAAGPSRWGQRTGGRRTAVPISRARRGGSRSSRAPRSAGLPGCCRCRGRRRRASGRCARSAPRSRARRRSRARVRHAARAGGRG